VGFGVPPLGGQGQNENCWENLRRISAPGTRQCASAMGYASAPGCGPWCAGRSRRPAPRSRRRCGAPTGWRTCHVKGFASRGGEPRGRSPLRGRTAFSAERIVADDGQTITFTYRDGKTGARRQMRLPAERFLHRFLQHVLPPGPAAGALLRLAGPGGQGALATDPGAAGLEGTRPRAPGSDSAAGLSVLSEADGAGGPAAPPAALNR
jgi:hypothetical protein